MEIMGYFIPFSIIMGIIYLLVINPMRARQRQAEEAKRTPPKFPPPAGGGSPPGSPFEARLLELKRLRDQGLISEKEYQQKRAEILARL
jgi:hypothetical protein